MTDEEVGWLANEVIRPILGPHGFQHAEVRSDYDHTDEPAIYVTLTLKPGSDVVKPKASMAASLALRHALEALGDERFPYLRYHYPDDEVYLDEADVLTR